ELIERRAARNHHRRRGPAPASCPPGALPCGGNRSRIAGHYGDVERADDDPELERVGRDDGAHLAVAKSLLDLAAPVRQVAAAVAANPIGRAWQPGEILLQVRRQQLGRQPALREDDQLQIPLQELRRDAARLAQIRAPDAELMIDDRRVDEQKEFLTARRAALLDE